MTDDQLFEDHPDLLDLERLAIGHQADPGATVRLARDQPLLVEPDEGGADRGPAGVQPKREVSLDQSLIGVKAAADDLIPQPPVGVGAAILDGPGLATCSGGRRAPRRVSDNRSFQCGPSCAIMPNIVDNPANNLAHGGEAVMVDRRLRRFLALPALALVLALTACGSSGGSTGSGLGSGDLLVGVLAPFSGVDANLGPAYYAACLAAAPAINNNGGVGGRHVTCQKFDTRGEPADAAPAANQMVASNSNLMAVVGCTSDEASAVAPIVDRAHIPMFCMTGQSEFNKTKLPYFHRLVPADIFDAYGMVGWVMYGPNHPAWNKVALVFGDDIGSQSFVQPATNALQHFGKTVKNFPIHLGASSFRTEVQSMLDFKPDVIFTEALGSAGTYLGEVKELNGGQTIPFIGTSATIDPAWFKDVTSTISVNDVVQYYRGVDLGYTFSGKAYDEFKANLQAAASTFADAPKYGQRGSTLHLYDGIIMTALAMVATNSKDPTVYNPKIKEIANGTSGATVVHMYKEGLDALNAGKSIRYVGAAGENNFDQYNNSQSGYILVKYDAQGGEVQVSALTPEQTKKLSDAGGL
jgi:ABC-type branched-subunit amino acid transport system substrate-binding protein